MHTTLEPSSPETRTTEARRDYRIVHEADDADVMGRSAAEGEVDDEAGSDEPEEGAGEPPESGGEKGDSKETKARQPWRLQLRGDVTTMVVNVLQAALIAYFGFTLTGRLDLALKERKATVDAAKSMGDLIVQLNQEHTPEDDRALMLRLAMFGEDAVDPMVFMAMTPGAYGPDIPIFGLRIVGITRHDATCKALDRGRTAGTWLQDPVRGKLLENLYKDMRC